MKTRHVRNPPELQHYRIFACLCVTSTAPESYLCVYKMGVKIPCLSSAAGKAGNSVEDEEVLSYCSSEVLMGILIDKPIHSKV